MLCGDYSLNGRMYFFYMKLFEQYEFWSHCISWHMTVTSYKNHSDVSQKTVVPWCYSFLLWSVTGIEVHLQTWGFIELMFICSVPFVESICLQRESNIYFKIEQNLGTIVLKVLYGDYSLKDKISLFYGTVEVYGLWTLWTWRPLHQLLCACYILKTTPLLQTALSWCYGLSQVDFFFESRSISETCGFIGSLFVCSGTLYHCCSNMIRRRRNQIRQMHMMLELAFK